MARANLEAPCAALILALLALPPARAEESCGLTTRVPYAGHAFPLEGGLGPAPMTAVPVFSNLSFAEPTFVTAPPDGSDRLFVLERGGHIWVFPNSPDAPDTPAALFLDLTGVVGSQLSEEGLLGLAFDPDFASTGELYVNYTAASPNCGGNTRCTRVERYSVQAGDPNAADPASAELILSFRQPQGNHNGGMLAFGPDGMLYIGSGDGGGAGDSHGRGQSTDDLLGAILRIDPRAATPYAIPADNPFAGDPDAAPEIWHYGLRNPWRFSFDRADDDLWIADVGEDAWEEIDLLPAATPGGVNFGWSLCEGTHDFNASCAAPGLTAPVIEYGHDALGGSSVTGGYVYRGAALPSLYGSYVYADHVSGRIWAWDAGSPSPVEIAQLSGVSSFGEDEAGEIYLVGYIDGKLYRLEPSGAAPAELPGELSQTGLFDDVIGLVPAPGLVEYEVTSRLWSDRARKRRWIALPGSQRIHFETTDAWDFPVGTALVKHFDLPLTPTAFRRLETRVFLRQTDRWLGFTYRWNDSGTEAFLLTGELSEDFQVDLGAGPELQTWTYPSPQGCLGCHTAAAGRVLGVRTRQLNRAFDYPAGTDNQLHAWSCIDLFDADVGDPAQQPAYVDPTDAAAPRLQRVRAYLAANCAICHQPLAPAPGSVDLRFAPLLGDMQLIGVPPSEGDLGLASPERIKPGVREESVLWHRLQTTDPTLRMPPGTRIPDADAVALLGDWIDTGLGVVDSDDDGVADAVDRCPRAPDPGQADTGGLGTGSAPDGIGDACQCGDLTLSGRVDAWDIVAIRYTLAGTPGVMTPEGHRRCTGADSRGRCTVVDAATIQRAVSGPASPIPQTCAAALEPGF